MKKNMATIIILFCSLVAANSQDYRNAKLYDNITIEQNANRMAGYDGSFEFFDPNIKFKNPNYKTVGVRIERDEIPKCEFVYVVDTINNIVDKIQYALFNGKKITYDEVAPDGYKEYSEEAVFLQEWQEEVWGDVFEKEIDDFFMGYEPLTNPALSITERYSAKRAVLEWYADVPTIMVTNSNRSAITVDLVFGYKQEDYKVKDELDNRLVEIQDFLHRYFKLKTAAELKPENEDLLKIEIRNAVNDQILSKTKIRDVAFKRFDVVQK